MTLATRPKQLTIEPPTPEIRRNEMEWNEMMELPTPEITRHEKEWNRLMEPPTPEIRQNEMEWNEKMEPPTPEIRLKEIKWYEMMVLLTPEMKWDKEREKIVWIMGLSCVYWCHVALINAADTYKIEWLFFHEKRKCQLSNRAQISLSTSLNLLGLSCVILKFAFTSPHPVTL